MLLRTLSLYTQQQIVISMNFPDTLTINQNSQTPTLIKNSKGQLRKMDQHITIARNRLSLLQQQLEREKQLIRKNKGLTHEVIVRKISVHEVNNYKQKDCSQEIARVEFLRKRNLSLKLEHEKSLENIQKALYLVKLDDAREVKIISEEHRKKIKEMENDQYNKKSQKTKQVKEESEKSKERYLKYWKQKISSIYAEQAFSAYEVERVKAEKENEIKSLQKEQLKLLEEINAYQYKSIESKKEYVAALSLPTKQVAQALQSSQGHRTIATTKTTIPASLKILSLDLNPIPKQTKTSGKQVLIIKQVTTDKKNRNSPTQRMQTKQNLKQFFKN